MRDLVGELVEFVDEVVDELGSRKDVEYLHTMLREGTSADRAGVALAPPVGVQSLQRRSQVLNPFSQQRRHRRTIPQLTSPSGQDFCGGR
jgi:hypothetical protein